MREPRSQARPVRRPRVLIAGGGVAAVETLLALRDLADEVHDVELISPERELRYRPMGVVEPLHPGRVSHHDLAAIAADLRASVRFDAVIAVDPATRTVCTQGDARLPYDHLVIAVGAARHSAIPDAITFRGGEDGDRIRALHDELRSGAVTSIAFVVPPGVTWPFPLYELALSTAALASAERLTDVELVLVTPADAPLTLFGARASEGVGALLREAGIRIETGAYARGAQGGRLAIAPGDRSLLADRVVALPVLRGPHLAGLPADHQGFVPVDADGAVPGLSDVWAVGDATTFPVKQGGIATQQADAVAAAIAHAAGAPGPAEPFRPLLRGVLFTGHGPRYLEADISGGRGDTSRISERPLWSPPMKVLGRYLAPYLAARESGRATPAVAEILVELDPRAGVSVGG
jgi:sulfide:quinone oxidoreductase